jgi:DNA-binding transcriptional ArsR family regulator
MEALKALAHPARLSILRLVSERERPVSELSEALDLRQPATSQHLAVLRDADLVKVRQEGNVRLYRSNPRELEKLRNLLDGFWEDSLERLKVAAERRAHHPPSSPRRVRAQGPSEDPPVPAAVSWTWYRPLDSTVCPGRGTAATGAFIGRIPRSPEASGRAPLRSSLPE